jgi:hypothetical protein
LIRKGKGAPKDVLHVRVDGDGVRVGDERVEMKAVAAMGGAWTILVEGRVHDAVVVEKKPGRFEARVSSQDFLFERVAKGEPA